MKRIYLILILITIILIFNCEKSFADNFQNGVSAYKQKDYNTALKYLSMSIQENKSDPLRLYFLGLTLKNLGEHARAQKAFNSVLKLKPTGDLLNKVKQEISTNSSTAPLVLNAQLPQKVQQSKLDNLSLPNYLEQAILDGKIIRWDIAKMPLNLYIETPSNLSGYKPEFKNMVIKAAKAWESASKSKIRFSITSNVKNANIKVTWKDKFSGEKIGESPFISIRNTIIKSDIVLSTTMPDGTYKLPNEVYSVALHEMGHALGIRGHSPYNDDVMYFSLNKENYHSNLSSKDVNTINMLYKTDADVSNSLPISMEQNKEYQKHLLLADKYVLQSDYKNALANYLAAFKIYNKEAMPHFNAGICYMNLGEYLNSLNEFELSKSLNPQNYLSFYNAAVAQVKLAESSYKNDPVKRKELYLNAIHNLETIQYKNGIPSNTSQILIQLKSRV